MTEQNKPRVLVLGGGFAGAFTANALRKKLSADTEVELISDRNYFVFQPLLPEVVAGTINAQDAVTPLRLLLKGVRVRMGEVRSVDFDAQRVQIAQGSNRIPQHRRYDQLVLALGQRTTLERFPGFAEHSFTMRDLADAHRLRNHVLQCLEHADVTENADLRQQLLTFIVAGGGFSGVEIVGELHEMLDRTMHLYPNLKRDEVRSILMQRSQRILPELPEKLGGYAAKMLSKRGVDIRFGTSLARATATAVYTQDGERIETSTLITTVGNGPTRVVDNLGLQMNRGRIEVDEYMRVVGKENVWALGDAAAVPTSDEEVAPTTAQFAVREAKIAAKNIVAQMKGAELTSFSYAPKGAMASIGHYRGVAEVLGINLSGLLAWLFWRAFYIGMLPGFSTRLRVALNWAFDYVLPRSIVQVKTTAEPAAHVMHYASGDVLFKPDQLVDGFYTVLSGTLESRVPVEHAEDFVRILGEGDHWGEKSLAGGSKTRGWLTAVDDCEILVLRRDDFNKLRNGLRPVDEYFKRIPDKIYPPSLRD